MQLFPIVLIAIVIAAAGGLRLHETHFGVPASASAILAWAPIAGILALTWLGVRLCRRRLDRGGSPRLILTAERITHYGRWLMLASHAAAVLAFGWLDAVRSIVGDLILIDELITILPPVVGVIGTWWIYYPIEKRLRESVLIRRLDEGMAIHPIPSRGRYVGVQARMGLLLLLVPILMIVGLAEAIRFGVERLPEQWAWAPYAADGATVASTVTVFMFAPLIARVLLHVEPLRTSELRDGLMEVCRRHRVRVRELLLWNTSGSMINAAVMGLIGPLRYVLITDALIESMREDEIKAVMAHEVGHVRRHHLPWLVLALIATLFAAAVLVEGPLRLAHFAGVPIFTAGGAGQGVMMVGVIAQLFIALWVFGWVSRRFERQADTFAVQHLSGLANPGHDPEARISPEAIEAMTGALDRIAQLNAVDPQRHSWRHGSIAWRKHYLASLVGAPIEGLPIDRVVRGIKRASAAVLLLTGAAWALLWWLGG